MYWSKLATPFEVLHESCTLAAACVRAAEFAPVSSVHVRLLTLLLCSLRPNIPPVTNLKTNSYYIELGENSFMKEVAAYQVGAALGCKRVANIGLQTGLVELQCHCTHTLGPGPGSR